MTIDDHILKCVDNRHLYRARARVKFKRPIRDSNCADLTDQIRSLQKAVANQRGDFERFRQDLLAKVQVLIERSF